MLDGDMPRDWNGLVHIRHSVEVYQVLVGEWNSPACCTLSCLEYSEDKVNTISI